MAGADSRNRGDQSGTGKEPTIYTSFKHSTNEQRQICSSAPALRPLIAAFLPRLLQSTRNIGSSYNQRSRSHKLWSSTGRSRNSRLVADDHRQPGYDSDRFEIMRTIEMESWTESRLANHDKMGHGYDITSENHPRALSPTDSLDMKNGMVYTSAASAKSSGSGQDSQSPFGDRPPH